MGEMITTRDPKVQGIMDVKQQERLWRKNWAELKWGKGINFVSADRRLFSNTLEDNTWKGQRCFIIGGGPSLRDFDFSKLKGELVIGVNRAYERIDCTVMFSLDSRYYAWIVRGQLKGEAKKKLEDFKGYKVWLDSSAYVPYPEGVYLFKSIGGGLDFSWSLKNGLGGGCNSGYGAVNLAVCLGANPIYLLGFDMKGDGKKQAWWHDGYPAKQPDSVYRKYIERFTRIAPTLKAKGIKVINLNSDSAMRCFEFEKFKDIEPIKRPIVISYYTEGTGYEKEVQGLLSSLRRFNLEYDIKGIKSLGDWQKNTHYKAKFIKAMLMKHRKPVLWIDADAVINKYPFLFNDLDADVACYFRNYGKFPISSRKEGKELLSGTLYFDHNEKVLALLSKWIKANKANPTRWEQKNLEEAIKGWDGRIVELPPQYCKIFDTMKSVDNPAITHYQASRHLRKDQ